MKNLPSSIAFLSLSALMISVWCSCKKDEICDNPNLPCQTHEGKNTFGCLIDGSPFVADVKFSIGGPVSVSGSFDESSKYLILEGAREDENGKNETVKIRVYVLNGAGEYPMWATSPTAQGYTYFNNPNICNYYYDLNNKGAINITYLNESKNIISGIFEMTLINPDCSAKQTMDITEGRFDFGY